MQRAPEVRRVHRGRKEMHVWMLALFGAIEARPTGEDDVRALQELPLAFNELRRGKVKGGQFVHTVENQHLRLEKVDKRQRHRSVHPQEAAPELFFADETLNKHGE